MSALQQLKTVSHPITCYRRIFSVRLQTPRYAHSSAKSNVAVLRSKHATIHLLGTMHISEASAIAARNLITREYEKGTLGAVFLELDEERFHRLKKATSNPDESLLSYALAILSRRRNPLASFVEIGIGGIYRALHRLGFASGVEFKAAIKTAENFGISIVLGDQPLQVTMEHLGTAFRKDFDLPRLAAMLMSQSGPQSRESSAEKAVREAFQAVASGDMAKGQEKLTELIDRDTVNQLIEPMRVFAPNVTQALVHQRDVFMVKKLITASERLPEEKRVIVGIVGLAHVDGIVNEWNLRNEAPEKR